MQLLGDYYNHAVPFFFPIIPCLKIYLNIYYHFESFYFFFCNLIDLFLFLFINILQINHDGHNIHIEIILFFIYVTLLMCIKKYLIVKKKNKKSNLLKYGVNKKNIKKEI